MEYFDRRCFSLTTAIKSVWLLFLLDKWELLESIGIHKDEEADNFVTFREVFVPDNPKNRIRSAVECRALVLMCPAVLDAALELSGRYLVKMSPELERIA